MRTPRLLFSILHLSCTVWLLSPLRSQRYQGFIWTNETMVQENTGKGAASNEDAGIITSQSILWKSTCGYTLAIGQNKCVQCQREMNVSLFIPIWDQPFFPFPRKPNETIITSSQTRMKSIAQNWHEKSTRIRESNGGWLILSLRTWALACLYGQYSSD